MWISTTAYSADLGDKEAANSQESSSALPRRFARWCLTGGVNCSSIWRRNSRASARAGVNPQVDSLADGAHADEQKLAQDPVWKLTGTEWLCRISGRGIARAEVNPAI